MSSLTRGGAGGVNEFVNSQAAEGPGDPPQALTERQIELERLYAYFTAETYSGHSVDWDGKPVIRGTLERASVVQTQSLPPGFTSIGGDLLPLKFRKPTAPNHLARVIVKRFSGLLFSTKRRPVAKCEDSETATQWLNAFIKYTRLWPKFLHLRDLGGAMGSCGAGLKFQNGRPVVEIFDPRWCVPTFRDRDTGELAKIEIKYVYKAEIIDAVGHVTTQWCWYRRVIDRDLDRVWAQVPADKYRPGEEPKWLEVEHQTTAHGLGFCPAIWIQNTPVLNDIDGDPDCHGAFDMIEAADQLLASAHGGAIKNADPTLVVSSTAKMNEVRKGSENAIKLPDGSAEYLEISGAGLKYAEDLAKELEAKACRIARCVLEDNMNGPARTEMETQQNYSMMWECADALREQYGEGARRLLELAIKAAAQLSKARPVQNPDGTTTQQKYKITLPGFTGPIPELEDDGDEIGVDLIWPEYYQPGLDQIGLAVTAAVAAKDGGLIDRKHAVDFTARYFNVADPEELAEELDKAAEELNAQMMGSDLTQGQDVANPTDDTEEEPDEEETETTEDDETAPTEE